MNKKKFNAKRLLELSYTVDGIIRELKAMLDVPDPTPKHDYKAERIAHYKNEITKRIAKNQLKKQQNEE